MLTPLYRFRRVLGWFALAASVSGFARGEVVLENRLVRLEMSDTARVTHLVYKPTGEECVLANADVPAFSAVDTRGFSPAKVTPAHSVRLEGDRLVVTFEPLVTIATFRVHISDDYLAVTLEKIGGPGSYKEHKAWESEYNEETQPFEEFRFFQIPLRERGTFGSWLNVDWNQSLAVNLLATNPETNVGSTEVRGARVLGASMWPRIRTAPVGVALVVSPPADLLNHLAQVEADFNLPSGAKSRQSLELAQSCWEVQDPLTPANVDRVIAFAKAGGLKQIQIYHGAFSKSAGHFPWRDEYPHGMDDLHAAVSKLNAAGLTVGLHIHFNKSGANDPYVAPVPDPRLNLRRHFTLAASIPDDGSELRVFEKPEGVTLDEGRRVLRFGNELIGYESYSTDGPYVFKKIKRAVMGTRREDHAVGQIGGLLDVDNWPVWVRFNQETDIQDEMAEAIGRIYRGAGFRFTYFDGSEDVPPPTWYNVAKAQWRVYHQLKPEPLFSEASHFSHFDWHMMSRSHAEDTPRPSGIKPLIRGRRLTEAAAWAREFTICDFGWIRFYAGDGKNIGMQPDIIEYAASRGAGWHCPLTITGSIEDFSTNPRTADNLEVLRRWQQAESSGWLNDDRRTALKLPAPEHTLLVDEKGSFELDKAEEFSLGDKAPTLRAFLVQRPTGPVLSFWDVAASCRIRVPLAPSSLRLARELGHPLKIESDGANGSLIEVGNRQYLEPVGIKSEVFEAALRNATVVR